MSELLKYKDSIERAVRIGIMYPKQEERAVIESAIKQRVNWNCSDCILRAYKRANMVLQRELREQATAAVAPEAETEAEEPKSKTKKKRK